MFTVESQLLHGIPTLVTMVPGQYDTGDVGSELPLEGSVIDPGLGDSNTFQKINGKKPILDVIILW